MRPAGLACLVGGGKIKQKGKEEKRPEWEGGWLRPTPEP